MGNAGTQERGDATMALGWRTSQYCIMEQSKVKFFRFKIRRPPLDPGLSWLGQGFSWDLRVTVKVQYDVVEILKKKKSNTLL